MLILLYIHLDPILTLFKEPPPTKRSSSKPKVKNQYGGPGSFVPSDAPASSPSTPPNGSSTPPRGPYTASPSRGYGMSSESLPSSLRASSSILQNALYVAPYETSRSQRSHHSVDNLVNDFTELGVQNEPQRSAVYHVCFPLPCISLLSPTLFAVTFTQSYISRKLTQCPCCLPDRFPSSHHPPRSTHSTAP